MEVIRTLSREDATGWFRAHLAPSSASRRALCVQVFGKGHLEAMGGGGEPTPHEGAAGLVEVVPDIAALAKSLPLCKVEAREAPIPEEARRVKLQEA